MNTQKAIRVSPEVKALLDQAKRAIVARDAALAKAEKEKRSYATNATNRPGSSRMPTLKSTNSKLMRPNAMTRSKQGLKKSKLRTLNF